jgi:hypothetical protein
MTATVVQDIIDTILHNVEDRESLKACSIVARSFRDTSQRILLRSLTLFPTWRFKEACTLLNRSPHIAGYITRLSVHLSSFSTADARHLLELLGKLSNVRHCTLEGPLGVTLFKGRKFRPFMMDGKLFSWKEIGPIAPALLDFLQRQRLAELHVQLVDMFPWSGLLRLFASTTRISLHRVSVFVDRPSMLAKDHCPTALRLDQLLLVDSKSVCEVLGRQDFAFFTANLRTLGLIPDPRCNNAMFSAASATLEHIRFERSCNCFLLSASTR